MAKHAREAVLSIAEHLREPAPLKGRSATEAASLANGAAGLAIFYSYLSRSSSREKNSESALNYLEQATRAIIAGVVDTPSLFLGLSGVAWVIQHLQPHLIGKSAAVFQTQVETELLSALWRWPTKSSYDLLTGLVGVGVYFLERLPTKAAVAGLEAIIDRLEADAEHSHDGVTLRTRSANLPRWQSDRAPRGWYDLGMAHGIAGVIAFLAEVHGKGIRTRSVSCLLDRLVEWLLAHERQSDSLAAFQKWVVPGSSSRKGTASRVAWCYGDLGIALAILKAGYNTSDSTWKKEAIDLAHRASLRISPKASGVRDACLCHGAAGNGHLFNRLFQRTHIQEFKRAAVYWFAQTLALRRPGAGVAGYLTWTGSTRSRIPGGRGWVADPGVLTGAAGIGLTLLSAIQPIEPAWDRMLLCS
jgi:lantibiotic modifying enzyme